MELSIRERNELIFDPLVCVSCGYCKSTCPTYLATRDERFSPRGRLILSRKLLEETVNFTDELAIYNDLDTCSKCLECERVCPMGLKPWFNFVRVKNKTFMGKLESLFAKFLINNRFLFSFVFSMAWGRDPSDVRIGEYKPKPSLSQDVLFFPTCFGYTVLNEEKKKFQILFEKLGINFLTLPSKFSCCGAPLLLSGDIESFKENAEKLILKIRRSRVDFKKVKKLVVMGGTCTWTFKEFIIPEFEDLRNIEVSEAIDFVISELENKGIKVSNGKAEVKKFLLHKPCHGHSDSLERFFSNLGWSYEITDFYCCGFGGSLFFKHKKMSNALGKNMVEGKSFDFVVSTSPGCIIQLSKFGDVRHAVDIIFKLVQGL